MKEMNKDLRERLHNLDSEGQKNVLWYLCGYMLPTISCVTPDFWEGLELAIEHQENSAALVGMEETS